jgi:hypothetical protein
MRIAMTRLPSKITRAFGSDKRYRIVSSVTGPGIGYPYKSRWVAAYYATKFEYTEWRLGMPFQRWSVESNQKDR